MWAILKKDLGSFCRSWVGVLALSSFLLIAGIFFTLFLLAYTQLSFEAARRGYQEMRGLTLTAYTFGGLFLNLGVVLIFLAPLLSMRSVAEEKRTGTLELLYTYPLSDFSIVAGKYGALVAQFALMSLPMLSYLGVMKLLGVHLDYGIVGTAVLGFFLAGCAFLAIGLFFSSVTENQMIASSLTFVTLLGLWLLEWASGFLPRPWANGFAALSPFIHFRDFSMGIIDMKDVVYFLAVIGFSFFVTLRVVETRNWKG